MKSILVLISILLFTSCESPTTPVTREDGYVYIAIRGWNEADHGDMTFRAHFRVDDFMAVYPHGYFSPGGFYHYSTVGSGEMTEVWYENAHWGNHEYAGQVWKRAGASDEDGEEIAFPGGVSARVQIIRGEPDHTEAYPYFYIVEGTEEYTHTEYVTVDGDIYVEFHMDDFL